MMTTKFLLCCKLETGGSCFFLFFKITSVFNSTGVFIGWLTLISNILFAVTFSVLAILLSIFPCNEIREYLLIFSQSDFMMKNFSGDNCLNSKAGEITDRSIQRLPLIDVISFHGERQSPQLPLSFVLWFHLD